MRRFIGQTIFVVFGFLAFVSLCGAAVTIGSLGVDIQRPDTAKALRGTAIAAVMSIVFFGVGYFGRRIILPRPKAKPRSPGR